MRRAVVEHVGTGNGFMRRNAKASTEKSYIVRSSGQIVCVRRSEEGVWGLWRLPKLAYMIRFGKRREPKVGPVVDEGSSGVWGELQPPRYAERMFKRLNTKHGYHVPHFIT